MLEDVAVHHPAAPIDGHHAHVEGFAPVEQHRISEIGLVGRLPVAGENFEKLTVDMHRVQPGRVVLKADPHPPAFVELGDFVLTPRPAVDGPLNPVGASRLGVEYVGGVDVLFRR